MSATRLQCNLVALVKRHDHPRDPARRSDRPRLLLARPSAGARRSTPGDAVRFQSLNAGWRWEPEAELFERDAALHGGHALNGPIEVRGARAGADARRRDRRGDTARLGRQLRRRRRVRWRLDDGVWHQDELRVALAPFLGVIGMPPAEPGIHSTTPPRRFGGNIDCKLLVAGTTLYLPIPVDGALLSAGDGHGAQGDGEVSGTAIECPLERVAADDRRARRPRARACRSRARPTRGSRSASTRISTTPPSSRSRRCSTCSSASAASTASVRSRSRASASICA